MILQSISALSVLIPLASAQDPSGGSPPARVDIEGWTESEDWAMDPAKVAASLPALQEITDRDPGGTLLVTQGDRILHTQAFGLASLRFAVPCTTETLYPSTGVAWSATQFLAMELEAAGAIDLDQKVAEVLPALKLVPGNYTLKDLVEVKAKYQPLSSLMHFRDMGERGSVSRREAVEILGKTRSLADWRDTETNALLLAVALETAMGEGLGALLETHIFAPAGMSNAIYTPSSRLLVAGGAEEVSWNPSREQWQAHRRDPIAKGDDCVWLSVRDALSLGRHFAAHSHLSTAYGRVLKEAKSEEDKFGPSGCLTVHYPERGLYVTWLSANQRRSYSSIPSDFGLYMLGRKSETTNSLLGIGGGAGGRFGSSSLKDYDGEIELGSMYLPEIGRPLILSEDKRGRLFVTSAGVTHARLRLEKVRSNAKTVWAVAKGSTVVTDRVGPIELAQMGDEERKEKGYTRSGVRRTLVKAATIRIEFEIIDGAPARPVSVDLYHSLAGDLSLRHLMVERASSFASR